jgi:hypothetical protein
MTAVLRKLFALSLVVCLSFVWLGCSKTGGDANDPEKRKKKLIYELTEKFDRTSGTTWFGKRSWLDRAFHITIGQKPGKLWMHLTCGTRAPKQLDLKRLLFTIGGTQVLELKLEPFHSMKHHDLEGYFTWIDLPVQETCGEAPCMPRDILKRLISEESAIVLFEGAYPLEWGPGTKDREWITMALELYDILVAEAKTATEPAA